MDSLSPERLTARASESARVPIIRGTACIVIAGTLIFLMLGIRDTTPLARQLAYVANLIVGISTLILLRFSPRYAGILVSLGTASVIGSTSWLQYEPSVIASTAGLCVVIMMAGFCWSSRSAFVLAALGSVIFARMLQLDEGPYDPAQVQLWAKVSVVMILMASLVHWALRAQTAATSAALLQERQLLNLVRASPDGMLVLGSGDEVQMLNPAAEQMIGLPPERVLGHRLSAIDWLDPDSVARLRDWNPTETADGSVRTLVRRGGRVLEASLSWLHPPSSESKRLLVVRDVTTRHETEQLKRAYEDQLRESQSVEALGRLASGVAHDFNNLLTVILASIDNLRAAPRFHPQLEQETKTVQTAAERGARLSRQLLAFARKQVLHPEVINANRIVTKVIPLMRSILPKGTTLRVECDPELALVRVDTAALEQVLTNLIVNARDSLPKGGTIQVRTNNCTLEGERIGEPSPGAGSRPGVCLSVRDDGEGLSVEDRKQIFQPFYSTKLRSSGSGLGLATVDGIVRQSGGYVHLDSAPGHGACFSVCLPRYEPPTTANDPESVSDPLTSIERSRPLRESSASTQQSLRVLLVEDEADVRDSLRRLLELLGHEVAEAESGPAAIQRFADRVHEFDILLTDISMPEMDGTELARQLMAVHPDLPILFMSGYVEHPEISTEDSSHGLGITRTAFLSKPFSLQDLRAALEGL